MVALVSLRKHSTLANRCRVGDQRVHRPRLHQRRHRPARRPRAGSAEGPARDRTDSDFVLLDDTLAERDRGGRREDHSHKHRRHSVNVQLITDSGGGL